jgi:hypothetical protein
MDDTDLVQQIENLLRETAESHHQAFTATKGEDPEWPLWYAERSLEKMRSLLNAKFTKSVSFSRKRKWLRGTWRGMD